MLDGRGGGERGRVEDRERRIREKSGSEDREDDQEGKGIMEEEEGHREVRKRE